jgi:glycolate oxidase
LGYKKIEQTDIHFFSTILAQDQVVADAELLEKYGKDETEDLLFLPEVVLKPNNAQEISQILKYCNQNKIPVTPRAAGTGLSAGALPVMGGVVLSIERLNKILKIDTDNLQAIAEPGVITQVFQEAVMEHNLYYPPDPSSRGSCFLGGNIAENAGGPRAVKYGVTSAYILNLEVVLPNGDVIETGASVLKNSTGYNLTQLMVGSEGTLGIVTKIYFRLIPLPQFTNVLLVSFSSADAACRAVSAVFKKGIVPSCLEFMEKDAIMWTLEHKPEININVNQETQAQLLIEIDGNHKERMLEECEAISQVMEEFGCIDILFADSENDKNQLWKLRRSVAEAVKANSVYKEEDTVVPRFKIPELLAGVKEIGERYGFQSVCYGHAGDGNIHVNIIKGDLSDEYWNNELPKGIREIFQLCVKLGGTLSGEHGIGWVQRPYMDIAFSEVQLNLMRAIKKVFDPNTILNPGKIF